MGDTIMAITINADTSNGLKLTSDTSGQIDFQSAGSTKALIDTSGNLKFNSGFGSAATAFGVRAWVNFNGTGTVAIRDSGNVSSITDNGTGNYTVNFTNNMPDVNYCMVGRHDRGDLSGGTDGIQGVPTDTTYAVGSVRFVSRYANNGTIADFNNTNVLITR
jgi:hypothetical protein